VDWMLWRSLLSGYLRTGGKNIYIEIKYLWY
jgi:hypothetical protein